MGLPSKGVQSAVNTMPFEIVTSIETPSIVCGVKRRGGLLKDFEPKGFHMAYKYYSTQMRVALCRFLDASIPDLQDLFARFLDVSKRVIVAERENWGIASRNQTNLINARWIS